MFDLIIANPPYGRSGNLARKIVNTLQFKTKELSLLTIAQGCKDVYRYATTVSLNDQKAFEDMWIPTIVTHLDFSKSSNCFENFETYRLSSDPKKLKFYEAVQQYNKLRKSNIEYLGQLITPENRKRFQDDSSSLFTIAFYSASPHHRISSPILKRAEDVQYNLCSKVINWGKPSSVLALHIPNKDQWIGFKNFWYGISEKNPQGWKSIKSQEGSLVSFILDCAYCIGGTTPSLSKYQMFIPNLDWSQDWSSDEKILVELGLPGDFLEKTIKEKVSYNCLKLTSEIKNNIKEEFENFKNTSLDIYNGLTFIDRKDLGIFYTPVHLAIKLLEQFNCNLQEFSTKTILDPTCGNGNLLIAALITGLYTNKDYPENVFGNELSSKLLELCIQRVTNFCEKYFEHDVKRKVKYDKAFWRSHIHQGDALQEQAYRF